MNKELNIVHVELKGGDAERRNHFYFSNMNAIYNFLDRDVLGIPYNTLRRKPLNEKTGVLYENDKCVIRKGTVITSPRKNPKLDE